MLLDTSVIIDPPEQGRAAFAAEVAEFYGLLANVVRQTGRNPRPRRIDLLIAATAVRHGFSLATRNGGPPPAGTRTHRHQRAVSGGLGRTVTKSQRAGNE